MDMKNNFAIYRKNPLINDTRKKYCLITSTENNVTKLLTCKNSIIITPSRSIFKKKTDKDICAFYLFIIDKMVCVSSWP